LVSEENEDDTFELILLRILKLDFLLLLLSLMSKVTNNRIITVAISNNIVHIDSIVSSILD